MVRSYQILKTWDNWLTEHFLGGCLLDAEGFKIGQLINKYYGKQALLIGVPQQYRLLISSPTLYHSLLTPITNDEKNLHQIESEFPELPILTGSIDLVVLPHTLELVKNPQKLLAEACRIIKPEGLIVICGFNPYGSWGVKKLFNQNKKNTGNRLIHAQEIKYWLKLADFVMEKQESTLFRPPLKNPKYFKKIHFLETLGNKLFPFLGSVYIILARAKVVPLTPIRLQWKQQLNGIRIPTLPGPIVNSMGCTRKSGSNH